MRPISAGSVVRIYSGQVGISGEVVRLVELVDTVDLKSIPNGCRFESGSEYERMRG